MRHQQLIVWTIVVVSYQPEQPSPLPLPRTQGEGGCFGIAVVARETGLLSLPVGEINDLSVHVLLSHNLPLCSD